MKRFIISSFAPLSQILLPRISGSPDARHQQRERCCHTGASQVGGLGVGEDEGDGYYTKLYKKTVLCKNSRLGCWTFSNLRPSSCQVFLRYYHVEQLNLLLRGVIARVVLMQAYTKGWLGARRYRKEKEKRSRGAVIIQSGTLALTKQHNEERNHLYLGQKYSMREQNVFCCGIMKHVRISVGFFNDLQTIMQQQVF